MWLLFRILKRAKRSFFYSQVCSFLTVGFNILLLATSAWLIATAALHPHLTALTLAITGVRFYGISRAVMRYLERYVSHHMAFEGLHGLRVWFYHVLEARIPLVFSKYTKGDLLGRVMGDIETLQFFFLRAVMPPVTAFLITLAFGYFLSLFNGYMVLVLVMNFLLVGWISPLIAVQKRKRHMEQRLEARSQIKESLVEGMNGMLDLVSYQAVDVFTQQMQALWQEEEKNILGMERLRNYQNSLMILCSNLSALAVLLLMIPELTSGRWEGVYAAVVTIAMQAYYEALVPMYEAVYHFYESRLAVRRLVELEAEPMCPIPRKVNTHDEIHPEEGLTLEAVSVAYDNRLVMDAFTMQVGMGEHVAIVGPSGAGKSTIVSAVTEFLPYQGRITWKGQDISTYAHESLREEIAVVPQEPYIFHASLEDNIRLSNPHMPLEKLQYAITCSGLSRLADSLGLATYVGAGGAKLSGGEKARVSLARMYAKEASLWLLDEPFEGLDSLTKCDAMRTLLCEGKGHTIVLITHQLYGLEEMDRIIFLSEGRIVEEGSYDVLMERKGAFYEYIQYSKRAV